MRIHCTHCHQDGDAGARITLTSEGLGRPACGRCGAPLYELDLEVYPHGTLTKALAELRHIVARETVYWERQNLSTQRCAFDLTNTRALIRELEEFGT